jgi:hypothetical protein
MSDDRIILAKARKIIEDYDAGRPLDVVGDSWLMRFATAYVRSRAVEATLLEALKQLRLNYVATLNAANAKIDQKSVVKADAAIAKAEGETWK